ncbi:MAG: histidine kinase [Burkholderiales bacterium]|nr:histidine kinase [Burkholderiales bacterium]
MAAIGTDEPHATLPRLPLAGFGLAWGAFWLLLLMLAVQDHLRQGRTDLWKPLLWEGSSFAVASLLLGSQWRRLHRFDRLITQPWRWFAAHLAWLPPAALGFVVAVYAIRHGVHALLGEPYRHEPWPVVLRYETLKFALFYVLFVAILFGVRSHVALADARLRAERSRALSQQAQLLQLTRQLEPHFLFNALNTIAETVHTDPLLADTLLVRLAALLRAATELTRESEVSLAEELQLLEGYIAIMRERFGDRVTVRLEVGPGAADCRVPTLLLQPLVENAFRHAVEPRPGRTAIVVKARREGARLELAVEDDGGAWPAAPVFGVGLTNLQQRLAMRYGGDASLRLEARAGGGVCAWIELPCGC